MEEEETGSTEREREREGERGIFTSSIINMQLSEGVGMDGGTTEL